MSKHNIRLFIDIHQDHIIVPVIGSLKVSDLPKKIEEYYEREKNKKIKVQSLKVKGAALDLSINDKVEHFLRDDDVIHTEYIEDQTHPSADETKKKTPEKSTFYCEDCERTFTSESHLKRHFDSKVHKDVLENKK